MECGVNFGDVSLENRFNKKGNNESQRIMNLHDGLLTANGGSWKSPPEFVLWNDRQRGVRDDIIRQYAAAGQAHWGFKDPRTLLALDGWLERLPGLQLFGIFRHPDAVAQSLTNRNLFTRPEGLELWYQYNRRLLALQKQRPFPLIWFTNDQQSFRNQLQRLIDYLAIGASADGFAFFEPSLQHFAPVAPRRLPTHVADVYQELLDIAANSLPVDRRSQREAA